MLHYWNKRGTCAAVCGHDGEGECTADYHKVTCKLCERWIRDNRAKTIDQHRRDEKRIFEGIGLSIEELHKEVETTANMEIPTLSASESWQMGFNAAKAHQADQRRWELAKELYQSRMTDLWRENLANRSRPSDDLSASFPDGDEQAGEVALLAVRDAAALLDAFDVKCVDPNVTALIAALDKMPQCQKCYPGTGPRICTDLCRCVCHEIVECVKRLEGKA